RLAPPRGVLDPVAGPRRPPALLGIPPPPGSGWPSPPPRPRGLNEKYSAALGRHYRWAFQHLVGNRIRRETRSLPGPPARCFTAERVCAGRRLVPACQRYLADRFLG